MRFAKEHPLLIHQGLSVYQGFSTLITNFGWGTFFLVGVSGQANAACMMALDRYDILFSTWLHGWKRGPVLRPS